MKRIGAILAVILLSSCSVATPLDTVKNIDYEISYWSGWKAIKYEQPKDSIDVIIYPESKDQEYKNVSVRISHEYNQKMTWGHIREATIDYPKNAVEKYKEFNYKLIHNEYVKKDGARKEEVLNVVFEGQADGQFYTIVQNIYALDYKAIYVTGFYPKDDKSIELQVTDIMESFKLNPPK
jgi:hypothetical protein